MAEWKVIVVLTCLWLMACSPIDDQASHFKTYLTRVAYVLEVPVPELTPPPPLISLPTQRELTLAPERISSGLLDALKLGRCDLLGLVAEHNGPIGKSQSAAGQFMYHLQFQQQLSRCLAQTLETELAEDIELRAWLQRLGEIKAPQLPNFYWNMMVAEPDIRAALNPAVLSLPFSSQPGFQETLTAFRLFSRLQQQAQNPQDIDAQSANELNQALKGLYKNPYLGRLLYSLHASAHYLEQSIAFLNALDSFGCEGAQAIKAERLRNAMQHYYIKDIQPYLGQLDRQFVELAPLLQFSLTPPAEKSVVMADYRRQVALGLDSELYVRYRELTLDHAKVWQRFLKRCELSPQRS